MIAYQSFEDSLKELSELTGTPIRKTQVEALYKILNGCNLQDFKKAIIAVAEGGDKPNLFALRKHINLAMADRLEKEARWRKEREDAQAKAFWMAHFQEGQCVKHDCGNCPKDFCHIVSNACIAAVKEMMSGDKTSEQAHTELAKCFPGIGFEQHYGKEPF